MELIEEGGTVPNRKTAEYKAFIKAMRGWYRQSINCTDVDTRARNKACFDIAEKQLEERGYKVLKIEKTGSISIKKELPPSTFDGATVYETEYEIAA